MQSVQGEGRNSCAHPTIMLMRQLHMTQLQGEIYLSAEVTPRSHQQTEEVTEIPAGAWVAHAK